MTDAKLLICIIERDDKLDDVLEALVEVGITGATILEVRGMFEYLADEIPLFAGFRNLIEDYNPSNKMVMSVMRDTDLLKLAMDTIESVYGKFTEPNSGIMFAIDIGHLRGLKF